MQRVVVRRAVRLPVPRRALQRRDRCGDRRSTASAVDPAADPGHPRRRPAAVTADNPVALVRRPGPRLTEGLVTHIERRPADPDLAARQWETYVATLREHGWRTVEVPAEDDSPDSVFVEDTVVVVGGRVAVLTRPGAPSRRAE